MVAPIDFDEVSPRGDGVVLAEADAAGMGGGFFEASPLCDAGLVAVGADEEAGAKGLVVCADEIAAGDRPDALDRKSVV